MMKKINIKTPSNINFWWNFGSLISFYMIIQIIMGFFLSMMYMIMNNQFNSSFFIYFNINFGWMLRYIHSNLTSIIFIILLIHIKRNFYYLSFFNKLMWNSGMLMFLIFMLISFLGYSLIWTQMSYWGMMVITNFISIIPLKGKLLMLWIWGNFKINIILINRFFSIHFIFPLILMMLILIHINILHNFKSMNPLGINNKIDYLNLIPNLIYKDLILFLLFLIMTLNIIFLKPNLFNNYDNYNMMNYFITPNHIEPEWYFLFFYSILRSIENKFSGLMLMIFSIISLFFFSNMKKKYQTSKFKIFNKFILLMIFFFILFITYFGQKNIEYPFPFWNKIFIILYFLLMLIFYLFN